MIMTEHHKLAYAFSCGNHSSKDFILLDCTRSQIIPIGITSTSQVRLYEKRPNGIKYQSVLTCTDIINFNILLTSGINK